MTDTRPAVAAFQDQMEIDWRRDMAKERQMRSLREEILSFLRENPRIPKNNLERAAAQLWNEMQAIVRRYN